MFQLQVSSLGRNNQYSWGIEYIEAHKMEIISSWMSAAQYICCHWKQKNQESDVPNVFFFFCPVFTRRQGGVHPSCWASMEPIKGLRNGEDYHQRSPMNPDWPCVPLVLAVSSWTLPLFIVPNRKRLRVASLGRGSLLSAFSLCRLWQPPGCDAEVIFKDSVDKVKFRLTSNSIMTPLDWPQ